MGEISSPVFFEQNIRHNAPRASAFPGSKSFVEIGPGISWTSKEIDGVVEWTLTEEVFLRMLCCSD